MQAESNQSIKIEVEFISTLRLAVGEKNCTVSLSRDSNLYDLANELRRIYQDKIERRLMDRNGNLWVLFSVNKQVVKGDYVLQEGDDVIIMPPLTGG